METPKSGGSIAQRRRPDVSGLYPALTTMTTVGYGDEATQTRGRGASSGGARGGGAERLGLAGQVNEGEVRQLLARDTVIKALRVREATPRALRLAA
jgi:hypothetical protein